MNRQPNLLFVIVAASAVGKGTLINQMKKEGLWDTVIKFSTRDNRNEDDDVIKIVDEKILAREK